MKRSVAVLLLVVALLLAMAAPSHAQGHGWRGHRGFRHDHFRSRVFIGVGPSFWWGPPAPYWWYYPPPYYVYSPPVIVQEPPVYIQQQPPPVPPTPPPAFWYYCPSAQAYYPNVPICPEDWIQVPPRPQ